MYLVSFSCIFGQVVNTKYIRGMVGYQSHLPDPTKVGVLCTGYNLSPLLKQVCSSIKKERYSVI